MLELRRSRSLKFVKHGSGSGKLHKERGPEMCIRVPLKLVEYAFCKCIV